MIQRESVPHEVEDDGGLLFDVERTRTGALTGRVRVWGHVVIDGQRYSYDRAELRIRLLKDPS